MSSTRTKIGNYFTLLGTNGMVMANVEKEKYDEGDILVTLFDTTGGREMEMGFFGGIDNGLTIKVNQLGEADNDELKQMLKESQDRFGRYEFKILLEKPGIFAFRYQQTIEGRLARAYIVITCRGIFSGTIIDAPSTELMHYDQVIGSAELVGSTSQSYESMPAQPQKANLSPAEQLEQQKEAMLRCMVPGKRYSIQELMEICPELSGLTALKVSSIGTSLMLEGKMKKYGTTFEKVCG